MTYSESTTNSTEPASDAIAAIEAALGAHAGWVFIEQYDFTQSVAKRARVWKCLGSQNNAGQDFYIALVKPTAAGQTLFSVRLFEGYNATTHQVIRPAQNPNASSGLFPSAIDFSVGNGTEYAFSLANNVLGGQADGTVSALAANTLNDHFIVVSKSFLAYAGNSASASKGAILVGNFVPAYSATYNPVSLYVAGTQTPSASGNVTRWPNCVVIATGGYTDNALLPTSIPNGYATATTVVADKLLGRMEAAGCLVSGAQAAGTGNISSSFTGIRGSLPTSMAVVLAEATPAPRNGDVIIISGVEYFRCGGASSMSPTMGFSMTGCYIAKAVNW